MLRMVTETETETSAETGDANRFRDQLVRPGFKSDTSDWLMKKGFNWISYTKTPPKTYFVEVAACDRLVEGLGFVAQRILLKLIYTN